MKLNVLIVDRFFEAYKEELIFETQHNMEYIQTMICSECNQYSLSFEEKMIPPDED